MRRVMTGAKLAAMRAVSPYLGRFSAYRQIKVVLEPVSPERYRELLPEPLQMPARPAVLVVVVDNREVSPWPMAPYQEGYVALRCRHMGEEGWHPLTMPVNQRTAMSAGRRLGLPKYVADDVSLVSTKRGWRGEVHHLGKPILRVEFTGEGGLDPGLPRERGFPMFTLRPVGHDLQVLRLDWNDGDGGNQRAYSGTVEVELGTDESWSDLLATSATSKGWFEEFEGSASLLMHDVTSNPGDTIVEGEVAIVTGAASGIGRSLCIELARRGVVVVATDVDVEGARQVAAEIERTGGRANHEYLDVTVADEVDAVVKRTLDRHGRLDYMFNNAGITIGGELRDVTCDQWERIIDVNLWGTINGTRSAYRVMAERGSGRIVNISSAAGLTPSPLNVPYAATKHAVVGLSTSLRPEAARLGVGVSVVCPGFVRTGIFESMERATDYEGDAMSSYMSSIKMMDPLECGRAILRGVERNRAIIIVSGYARAIWWANRIHPSILSPLHRRMVEHFGAARTGPGVRRPAPLLSS